MVFHNYYTFEHFFLSTRQNTLCGLLRTNPCLGGIKISFTFSLAFYFPQKKRAAAKSKILRQPSQVLFVYFYLCILISIFLFDTDNYDCHTALYTFQILETWLSVTLESAFCIALYVSGLEA